MSKKNSEAPPIYCVRYGSNLVGELAADRERIAEIKEGERIRISIQTGRIPKRLRFYWSFLREVWKATACAPTERALHSGVKLETGFTDDVLVRGLKVKVPASIAFENMDEETFGIFLQAALTFIASEYGIVPEQVFGKDAA
jgi:hypothetical protein